MERLTAAAATEPYDSVSCAFVSYGSCAVDLAEGWKYRSRLWYGVSLPSKPSDFGGGGSGWDTWNSFLEKDSNGNWIELPLVNKCVAMLQALLLDESGLGGGLGIGGGSGTGMGGMAALYQLLDSDQPFLCMLRMILVSLWEEDDHENNMLTRSASVNDGSIEGSSKQDGIVPSSLENSPRSSMRQSCSALLWRCGFSRRVPDGYYRDSRSFWGNNQKKESLQPSHMIGKKITCARALIIWYCIGATIRRKKVYNRGATFKKSTSSSFPRQKSTFEDQKSIIATTAYSHGAIFKKSTSSSPLSYKSTSEDQK